MNAPLILNLLGNVVRIVGLTMVPSLLVAVMHNGEDIWAFVLTIALMILTGSIITCIFRPKSKQLFAKDGFFIVGLTWIVVSLFGALPAYICGAIPSYIDSLFESISGFTTTGASILTDVEVLPMGILFWRSFTHWLGGMGVLVFALAVLPKLDARTLHLLKAESPGPAPDKIVPRLADSARILYLIYVLLTVILVLLLKIAGMPWFDSFVHAFGSAGTGGFSIKNASIGAYGNPVYEMIIATFILMFGVNFALYYYAVARRFRDIVKNNEVKLYFGIIIVSVIAISINISSLFSSVWETLRYSFFQVASIITTTGYATTNFDLWPWFSKTIIILLMLMGASAGSTGGGLKTVRILLLFKIVKREIRRLLHPRMVNTVQLEGKNISEEITTGIGVFFMIYFVIILFSTLLISLDGFDLVTNLTAVISAISNIGPGLALVGPIGNFSMFSHFSKIVLSICMLAGRLEIFPILIIATAGLSSVRRGFNKVRRV